MGLFERLFGGRPKSAAGMDEAQAVAARGDYETALAIWGPLAHAGRAHAANNIGACFAEGLGVARDMELALRWLTIAAEAGDAVGQRNLAALYFKGDGVEQNDETALTWYRAAAEQGDPPAQDMLAWMLLERGDRADFAEILTLSRAAAEAGIAASSPSRARRWSSTGASEAGGSIP